MILPKGLHGQTSAHYGSNHPIAGDLLVRAWLSKKSFVEQTAYGRASHTGLPEGDEMNDQIDALGVQYRKCAEAYGAASVRGDAKAMNRNFDILAAIGPKLRAYGEKGEAILRRLMKDRSEAVASWAATDSLPFAEAEGLEVLDAIATKHGPIPFGARMTAKEWRAGELKIR